jgi:hypothetical protein
MHPVPRVASTALKTTAVYVTDTIMMTEQVKSGLSVLGTVEDGSMKHVWKMDEMSGLFVTSAYNIAYMLN